MKAVTDMLLTFSDDIFFCHVLYDFVLAISDFVLADMLITDYEYSSNHQIFPHELMLKTFSASILQFYI